MARAAVASVLVSAGGADLAAWLGDGQPAMILQVPAAARLHEVVRQARAAGLPVELVYLAGRTQVAPRTLTYCAVGPAESHRVDAATAGLSLL